MFPDVEWADESGLLAIGGNLEVATLVEAYSLGIFPWPIVGIEEITWFAPPRRGVLFFEELHVPRSFRKFERKHPYRMQRNTNFEKVISFCAGLRAVDEGTWITPAMQQAYTKLHEQGFAHSIECYQGTELVGGLYGVQLGRYFAAESMFHLKPNTSKLCLIQLVKQLKEQGATWIDCQQCTPVLKAFGGREISREEFMRLHAVAIKDPIVSW